MTETELLELEAKHPESSFAINMRQQADFELVRLAAKAAGIRGTQFIGLPSLMVDWNDKRPASKGLIANGMDDGWCWCPLDDDGDALRLVVKLKLHIGMESCTVQAWGKDDFGNFQSEVLAHRGGEAATRRAIVRAAAYIGKKMP